jgi:hypothetical protein
VATSLSARLAFPADPRATYALLTDLDYVEEVAHGTGGSDVTVSVTPTEDGGAIVVSERTLPAKIPSYAKALVGETLTVHETRVFGPEAADGSREGSFTVGFPGAPITVSGTLALVPNDEGAELDLEMSVKASVPFVGGKIEQFAGEQVERFVAKEEQIAGDRLA